MFSFNATSSVEEICDGDEQLCLRCRPFGWPCRHVEAMYVALPDAANLGPH